VGSGAAWIKQTFTEKDQQASIDHVISQFKEYRKAAEQIAKQVS
jgi:hypothetical protein